MRAWSRAGRVKDVIAHVATWDNEALKALPLIMQAKRPPRYGGVDNFNARQYDANARLSLTEAREALASTHQRLLALLDFASRSPGSKRETRFRHRLRLDTWAHYPEHTQASPRLACAQRGSEQCRISIPTSYAASSAPPSRRTAPSTT